MAKGIAKMLGGGKIKAQRINDPFEGIRIPTIEEQSIILQNPDLVGQYTPEQIQVMEEMTSSAMEGIRPDEQAMSEQRKALQSMSEVAEGGLTEADSAAARQVQREVNQQAQARQKAILNAMASRGVLGSGMELQAKLQGEQQAIDQASRAGDALTQQAQARALQAMGQQGNLAGQMRSQQFGEQSDVARARDAINQFNTQNRQRVSEANVGQRNQAQMTNLQMQQERENQRAALANQQQQYNKALIDKQFQQQIQRAGGQASINQAQANANSAAQQAQAGQNAAVIGGLATIGSAFVPSDKNLKENISNFDVKDFLDQLNGHSYNYKNPEKFGEGQQVGVMAQDLEKSQLGKNLVENTDEGKMVDYSKSAPLLLASLAELNKRLNKLEGK